MPQSSNANTETNSGITTQDFIHPARVEAFRQMATLPEDIMPFDERDLRAARLDSSLNTEPATILHILNSLAKEGYKLKSAPNEEGIIQYEWDKD